MKHGYMIRHAALALTLLALLSVFGCTDSNDDRLSSLEAEVSALKDNAEARETALREELALVRKNLEAIREMLQLEGLSEGIQPDQSLDDKAKSLVEKNLDRLIDVTKKLLDKMEKELDEQLEKMKTPAPPQGDEI